VGLSALPSSLYLRTPYTSEAAHFEKGTKKGTKTTKAPEKGTGLVPFLVPLSKAPKKGTTG
jgi:hypothetical protein